MSEGLRRRGLDQHWDEEDGLGGAFQAVAQQSLPRTGSVSKSRSTPNLAVAAFSGDTRRTQEILEILRESCDTWEFRRYGGRTALMAAAHEGHLDTVRVLACDIPLECKDNTGNTALAYAVLGNHPSIVQFLLDQGSEINVTNKRGVSPIHIAARGGYLSCAETILMHRSRCNVNCKTNGDRWTPLFFAIEKNDAAMIQLLVHHSDRQDLQTEDATGFNSLHHAALTNCTIAVEKILRKAPDMLNSQNAGMDTALHIAALNDSRNVVLNLARRENCQINLKNVSGNTALHIASHECHIECIETLVRNGANVNVLDNDGNTSLHLVMMNSTMNDDQLNRVAQCFIKNQADVYIENNYGKNVLDVTVNQSTRSKLKGANRKKKYCPVS